MKKSYSVLFVLVPLVVAGGIKGLYRFSVWTSSCQSQSQANPNFYGIIILS